MLVEAELGAAADGVLLMLELLLVDDAVWSGEVLLLEVAGGTAVLLVAV